MAKSRRTSHPSRQPGRSWLPLVAAAALVLVAAIAVGALFWSPASSRTVRSVSDGAGHLVAEQATIDLGRVPFDKLTEARFELVNTGGEVVRLTAPPKVRMLEGC